VSVFTLCLLAIAGLLLLCILGPLLEALINLLPLALAIAVGLWLFQACIH
jgi:hypothetical protein